MSKKHSLKPLAAAIGTTFVVSLAGAPLAGATENPFALSEFSNGGYMLAEEGKCGEGKCGGEKKGEEATGGGDEAAGEGEGEGEGEKSGEGKCGGEKSGEGKCGG
jgi:uncharacterized low-complexity protein